MLYEFGDFNPQEQVRIGLGPRQRRGFALGSGRRFPGASNREPMRSARGAKPFARLVNVVSDHARRKRPGEVTASLGGLWAKLGKVTENATAIITGATGAEPATSEERAFLRHTGLPDPCEPARCSATRWKRNSPWDWRLQRCRISRGALFPPTIRPAES